MIDVVLVDEQDKEIGLMEKVAAHSGDGSLHRAFMAIIVNKNGEVLVTKRAAEKMLWPNYWDNACSSHPFQGESYIQAGERRLLEELGFSCPLKVVDIFQYQHKFEDIGAENEVCAVLVGEHNGEINPEPTEVSEHKWMDIKSLHADMAANPDIYTIWFKIAIQRLIDLGKLTI